MPRKKSAMRASEQFDEAADDVLAFAVAASEKFEAASSISWAHDYAVIRLYRAFETLMLDALVAAINNDTSTISTRAGFAFPTHLTDEVCMYLVVGNGYFDFRGRDGLIKILKQYVPEDHFLVVTVKKRRYKLAIEQLSGLRNFAAHDSDTSKRAALEAVGLERLASTGAWIKRQNRLDFLVNRLKELSAEIRAKAPY